MLDIIGNLIQNDIVQWVVVGVIVFNGALSGLSQGLRLVGKSEKTPNWISSVAAALRKVVDFFSANLPHK